MKKRMLIITSRSERTVAWAERSRYIQEFCEGLQARLTDFTVDYTTYDCLQFSVTANAPKIYDSRTDLDLKDYDIVHFKNWMYDTEEAPLTAWYLRLHSVQFYNSEVGVDVHSGKIAQMFKLAAAGVPVPDSFYASRQELTDHFTKDSVPGGFSYPLIMKANDGSKGDDNHLIRSAAQALTILSETDPEKSFILQNFIPNDGDYRILFIGLGSQPLIFHRLAVAGSHLNNTSKGGTGRFIDTKDFPLIYQQYALQAAQTLKREIGGVDVLVNKETNKPYILEVNGTPAIATGYGVEEKLERFVSFLEQNVEVMEEE